MTKPFSELAAKMSPESRERSRVKTEQMLADTRRRMKIKRLLYGTAICVALVALGFVLGSCGGDMGAGIYQNYEPAGGVDVDVPGVVVGE